MPKTPTAFVVRPPAEGDAAALGALHNLVWRHAYAGLMPPEYLASRDDSASGERWATRMRGLDAGGRDAGGRRILVAEAEGEPIGFVTVGSARRAEHEGMRELMALYVHPTWHGRGVAQALTGEVLADPTFCGRPIMLWVLEGNARAVRFYEKLGFSLRDDFIVHDPTGVRERLMVRLK